MTKVAVVTGSNKGIGYGIVQNLCEKFDGDVYLTARNNERGMEAVKKLEKLGLKPKFHQLDVDSDSSVEDFASFLKKTYGGLDLLVNNAAIAFSVNAKEPFAVQAEVTLKTNYFGLLRVCNALFPLLRPHARVVNLSSSCGFLHKIPDLKLRDQFSSPSLTVEKLTKLMNDFIESAKKGNNREEGWGTSAYNVSKVGVSALSRVQHQAFLADPREDIVINHVHPGYVDTDMTNHKGYLTIAQGADAATFLALLPKNCTSPKGDYVWHDRSIVDWVNGPSPGAY